MLNTPVLLENQIQDYAWGSKSAIQKLLGTEENGTPWAELWMGAHPKAPSSIMIDNENIPLDQLVSRFPDKLLGARVAEIFNNTLPFLFKVLAAEQPLSIQAHPNKALAQEGFERENRRHISLHAPHRNYRDPWPKPEIICAVEPFTALNGFRPAFSIADLFAAFCPAELSDQIDILKKYPDRSGIQKMFESIILMSKERKRTVIDAAAGNAMGIDSMEAEWVRRLHDHYPEDIGILCPLYLNLVRLEPFTAMFLAPGRMHAYLEGVGIELMANSDNVLRGGLTGKHMDTEELLRVVDFDPSPIQILHPVEKSDCESYYPTEADEFLLSMIQTTQQKNYLSPDDHGLEILLCLEGPAMVLGGPDCPALAVNKGQSILVPASAGKYGIEGKSLFFKASIPT